MTCEAVVERLPWLLNRTLPDPERGEVLAHLGSCDACRRELERTGWCWEAHRLHLSPETLLSVAAGESPDRPSAGAIVAHLTDCARCSEERDLALAGRPAREKTPRGRRAIRSGAGGWRFLAIAASLFAAVALAGYVQQRDRIRELLELVDARAGRGAGPEVPRLNVPILELSPSETLRGDREPTVLRLPGEARSVMLILLPGRVPEGVPLAVTLRDAAGEVVWTGAGLDRSPLGDFTLELPTAILEPEPMRLEITAAGEKEPSAVYDVTVRKDGS